MKISIDQLRRMISEEVRRTAALFEAPADAPTPSSQKVPVGKPDQEVANAAKVKAAKFKADMGKTVIPATTNSVKSAVRSAYSRALAAAKAQFPDDPEAAKRMAVSIARTALSTAADAAQKDPLFK